MAAATGPESPSNMYPNAAHYTGAHDGPRRHLRRGYTLGPGLTTQPHPAAGTGPRGDKPRGTCWDCAQPDPTA